MKIADLFINLALGGGDKTKKGLKDVEKGMDGIKDSGLAAKAAILAVIYGAERLTGFASQIGMDLYKFGVTTGLSTDELQKWQYAAMRFDVSGEEMAGTIKGIQSAMSDMLLGKGPPDTMALVGIDPKRARDTYYVLSRLQEFAKTHPPDIANNLLKSFGISDNVFQMLKSSSLEIDKISKKNIIGEREIMRLKEVNIAWKDFWFNLKLMGVHLVAKDGIEAINELSNAFKLLIDVGDNIKKLAEQFPVLKAVAIAAAVAISLAFAPLATLITGLVFSLSELQKMREGKETFIGKGIDAITGSEPAKKLNSYMTDKDAPEGLKSLWMKMTGQMPDIQPTDFALNGRKGAIDAALSGGTPAAESNATVNIYGVDTNNAPKVRDEMMKAFDKAGFQSPAMAQQGRK